MPRKFPTRPHSMGHTPWQPYLDLLSMSSFHCPGSILSGSCDFRPSDLRIQHYYLKVQVVSYPEEGVEWGSCDRLPSQGILHLFYLHPEHWDLHNWSSLHAVEPLHLGEYSVRFREAVWCPPGVPGSAPFQYFSGCMPRPHTTIEAPNEGSGLVSWHVPFIMVRTISRLPLCIGCSRIQT